MPGNSADSSLPYTVSIPETVFSCREFCRPKPGTARTKRLLPRLAGFGLLLAITGCRDDERTYPPSGLPANAAPSAPGEALELRLMSFNVRYETPEDQGTRSWHRRIHPSVRVIQEEKPDILGIQEALHGQAADLWASLPEYALSGVGRDDAKRKGEYSAILYRRDRFRPHPSDFGTFWLSDKPESPGSMTWGNQIPRIVTWQHLTDRATGRSLTVYNTHWDHRHQGSREKAAVLLARRIDQRADPSSLVLLLGDFNAVEDNPAIAYLTGKSVTLAGTSMRWEQPLRDVHSTLMPANSANRGTIHGWRGSGHGRWKIDHILASEPHEILAAAVRHHDEPPVSDHFPVTARLRFPSLTPP